MNAPGPLRSAPPTDEKSNAVVVSARPLWKSLLIGAGATAVAVLVRFPLQHAVGFDETFLLFFAAVGVAAWYGGLIPGLATTALAAVAATFFFVPPSFRFMLEDGTHQSRLALFVLECLLICVLCGSLHAARRRAERSELEAQHLERQLLLVSEAEQRRIGQDLHDGLGQQLTGIALLGKLLVRRLGSAQSREVVDAQRIVDQANAAIKHTRELARGLSPLDLASLSLPDALQRMTDSLGEVVNKTIVLRIESSPPSLKPESAMHLFRIAQESLNNALRHSNASRLEIILDHDGESTLLCVADNGKGIPEQAKGGMGLRLMRYRAKIIGGTLEIGTGSQGGTLVCCRVPDQPRLSTV